MNNGLELELEIDLMDPIGGEDEGSVGSQVNLWTYTADPSPGILCFRQMSSSRPPCGSRTNEATRASTKCG